MERRTQGKILLMMRVLPCFMRRWEDCTMYASNHYTRYLYETQKNYIR